MVLFVPVGVVIPKDRAPNHATGIPQTRKALRTIRSPVFAGSAENSLHERIRYRELFIPVCLVACS